MICDMMGKGKRLDASWTMVRKLLASVSYRIATRRKRFNLEKNREGLERVPAAEIKRAANFGKTLTTRRIAGLCRVQDPSERTALRCLPVSPLAAEPPPPPALARLNEAHTCNRVLISTDHYQQASAITPSGPVSKGYPKLA